jgi:hypothetical protein
VLEVAISQITSQITQLELVKVAEEKKDIAFVELKFVAITDYGFEDVD